VFSARAREGRGIPVEDPEVVFGSSQYAIVDEAGEGSVQQLALERRAPWVDEFISLAEKDSTFFNFLQRKNIDLSNLDPSPQAPNGNTIRKIAPVVAFRNAYKGKGDGKKRGRKPYTSAYIGWQALAAISEGNPRWLLGMLRGMLSDIEKTQQFPIPVAIQQKHVASSSGTFSEMLRTVASQQIEQIKTTKPVFQMLECIGGYFHNRMIVEAFSEDPPLSFWVDDEVTDDEEACLRIALNHGAIVCYESPDGLGGFKSLRGKRFRLDFSGRAFLNNIHVSQLVELQVEDLLSSYSSSPFIVLTALVGETRGNWFLSKFKDLEDLQVIALCDAPDDLRAGIVSSFKRNYARGSVLAQEEAEQRLVSIAEELSEQDDAVLRVVVDVSCMSRFQMGYVFAKLKQIAETFVPVSLSVAYCLAKFSLPDNGGNGFNRKVAPVHPVFSGWTTTPYLPIEVVVSLGYEKGKAIGAVEYLEPRKKWVFVPHSPEARFLREVRQHNRDLLASTPLENVINYDVLRPVDTYFSLLSLVQGVSQGSRPVLLPFGPKFFFAISLLVAATVSSASVWHVDSVDESSGGQQASKDYAVLGCMLKKTDRVERETS
jgi:hypothetical protein